MRVDADGDPYEEDEKPSQLGIVDESGTSIRELGDFDYATAVALSADGTRMLHATMDDLRIVDTDTGSLVEPAIDLRPLHASLALPEETEVWRRLRTLPLSHVPSLHRCGTSHRRECDLEDLAALKVLIVRIFNENGR